MFKSIFQKQYVPLFLSHQYFTSYVRIKPLPPLPLCNYRSDFLHRSAQIFFGTFKHYIYISIHPPRGKEMLKDRVGG